MTCIINIYQNVDINTESNLLRGAQTTEAHDLYLDNKITLREKDAVDRVGMHGAAVVKQHYLMCNQEAAARSSLEVGKALRSESIGPPKEATRPRMLTDDFVARGRATSTNAVPTNFLLLPWGSLHSSAGDMTKKASWDQAEILDLHDKYTQICKRFPDGVIPPHTAIVPELLKMVHADKRAIPIYNRRHIIDAGRMSTGYML
jgi:hypothetical protein